MNIPADANQWYYTGSYITLPPGRWIVNVMMLFTVENPSETRNYNIWLRSTFQDDTSTATLMGGRYKYSADLAATGVYVSGQMSPAQVSGIVSGAVIINNTSTTNKNYYYVGGFTTITGPYTPSKIIPIFGNNSYRENIMYAIRVG